MHDVFISYSSKDLNIANAVCHILEDSNVRCLIAPGAMWAESLVSAIKQSKVFVLVFSRNFNESKQVYKEISIVVEAGLTVIPFITSADKPQGVLEYYITDTHWIDALTPPLENHIHRLAERVSFLLKENPDDEIAESAMNEGQNAAGIMPCENVEEPQDADTPVKASAGYCLQCEFHHEIHHCPVCGAKRTDIYGNIKRGKIWIFLSSFAWLVLTAYSGLISVAFLNNLKDDYEYTRLEYVAFSMAFAAIFFFCIFVFEIVSRAIIIGKRAKKSEKEIAARLGFKNIPLYQGAFFTGIAFIVSQLVLFVGFFLTT